jgi:rubrerythrin
MSIADAIRRVEEKQQPVKADFFERWKPEMKKVPPMGMLTMVRASDLPYFCARAEVIRAVASITFEKAVTWKEKIRMARGTAMHRMLQNEILPAMGAIDGWWTCDQCGYHSNFGQQPEKCFQCGNEDGFSYQEPVLECSEFGLTGHCDGLWMDDESLIEIKTCGAGTYGRVVGMGPLHAHKVQAGAYLDMWNSMAGNVSNGRLLKNVRFIYMPVEDVTHVKIPAPADRKVPFEVDYDTGMITCKLAGAEVRVAASERQREVAAFRTCMYSIREGAKALPSRQASCKDREHAGAWRYGCPVASLCFSCEEDIGPLWMAMQG